MLVIGEKEMTENKVAVRRQGKGDIGIQTIDEFINLVNEEVKSKRSFEQKIFINFKSKPGRTAQHFKYKIN